MGELASSRLLRSLSAAALVLVVAGAVLGWAGPASAASGLPSASDLIAAVNEFRATQGLSPLTVDPILMQVAQAQTDYNVSTGVLSHYGPDGSRPRDQAIAAGYGGGATVFVSENIAMGSSLTAQDAVDMWTGDAPHLNTMLGPNYRDVGAGVGEGGGDAYFTLVTGYVAGGLSAHSTVPAAGFPPAIGAPPAQLLTATPQPDGSIIHIIEDGQTLWTVAAIYGIDLEQLMSLNGLTQDSFVHPGDRLVVRAAPTPTPSPAPSATTSPSPAPPTPIPTETEAPSLGSVAMARLSAIEPRDLLGAGCLAAWVLVVIAGLVIASRRL